VSAVGGIQQASACTGTVSRLCAQFFLARIDPVGIENLRQQLLLQSVS
jgi:hypothetical protein